MRKYNRTDTVIIIFINQNRSKLKSSKHNILDADLKCKRVIARKKCEKLYCIPNTLRVQVGKICKIGSGSYRIDYKSGHSSKVVQFKGW